MTRPTYAVFACVLTALLLAGGCSKKQEPAPKAAAAATATPAAAAPAPEVRKLVEDTKRYAESVKAQPAGGGASAEQLAKLPGLLEQLLRHMEERAQTSQQGGDVAKPEAQVVEDLKQIQEIQSALPAPTADQQGAPAPAGQEKTPVERISENLAKITLMAQQGKDLVAQGKDLVAIVRPSKDQPGASGSSEGASTPPADATQAAAPQVSGQASNESEPKTETAGAGETKSETKTTARDKVVLAATLPAVKTAGVSAASACCMVVANPALVGRFGRVVVTFQEEPKVDAVVDVYIAGKHIHRGHGKIAFAVLPGSYSVLVTSNRVDNVTVQSGHDTKVKVGVLRVNAPAGTTVDVYDKDNKSHLKRVQGAGLIGFPIGTVQVHVAGQIEAVTIQDGKITDF